MKVKKRTVEKIVAVGLIFLLANLVFAVLSRGLDIVYSNRTRYFSVEDLMGAFALGTMVGWAIWRKPQHPPFS